ncbi:ATP-binding protein [Streptomyces chryseus]
MPPDAIETARLIVSELTTNAIQHPQPSAAGSPEPRNATVVGPRLVIYVSDHDRRPPVLRVVGAGATSGRGLLLVETMSHRWGSLPPARHGESRLGGAGARRGLASHAGRLSGRAQFRPGTGRSRAYGPAAGRSAGAVTIYYAGR